MATAAVRSKSMRGTRRDRGPSVLDVLEDAYSLVRRAPLSLWAGYCVGTVPFVIGLVYFWADMSRGFHADRRCAGFALALTLLFVWCGVWQSWTAAAFKALAAESEAPSITLGRFLNAWLLCCVLQAAFLAVLPAAALMAAPLAWTVVFFRTASLLYWEHSDWRSLFSESARIAGRAPLRTNALMATLALLAASVFLDTWIILAVLPHVFKFLTGIETVFTRSGGWYTASTTFLAVTAAITYLAVTPLALAAVAVRCFYIQARTTGADLRLRFRRAAAPGRGALTALLAAAMLGVGGHSTRAAPLPREAAPASTLDARTFNEAADRVLSRPEFAWRLPRVRSPERQGAPGFLARFAREIIRTLASWRKKFAHWLRKPMRWLDRWLRKAFRSEANRGRLRKRGSPRMWPVVLRIVAWGLIVLGAILALIIYLRGRKRRATEANVRATPATERQPDLDAPYVPPQDLPYVRWLDRARELARQGAYRHALRALYLAALALLTDRNIIAPAPYKSNGEYRREVQRHAHVAPGLEGVFTEMALLFECVWYGSHPADESRFEQALNALQRMETVVAER